MRVLFIVNKIDRGKDGVGDYTLKLAEQFWRHKHELSFLTTSRSKEEVGEIFVIDEWGWQSIEPVLKVVAYVKPDWVIVQYVPFAFHSKGFPFWLCFLLIRLKMKRIKVAFFFHEIADRLYFPNIRRMLSSLINRAIGNILFYLSDKSWTSISFYHRYFLVNPDLIPVGSNISIRSRAAMKKSSGELAIATFGSRNLEFFKILIEATEILVKGGYEFKIKVLGSVPKTDEILTLVKRKGLSGHFYFSGFLKEDELELDLSNSDIFVNLNGCDHLGRGGTCLKSGSVAAGFAAGLAIVGFRGDMTGDTMKNGENMLLCNETSGANLAAKLEVLLTNSALRHQLQENAIIYYEKELSWQVIYDRWIIGLQQAG